MSWLWGGKGSGDIVEVLGHFLRVASNRSEERLAILQQLKQFSQKQENHELLGRAIGPLLKILKQSSGKEKDIEAVRISLEVLTNIMKLPEEDKLGLNYVEVINTDLFLKEGSESLPNAPQQGRGSAGLMLVLTQFSETDFQVRYNAMQLLEIVSGNGHLTDIQETCLSTPTALSNIVELLKDGREVIRNESLLLLIDLCTNNVEIQKMAGVLGAMEAVLAIVKKEGGVDGGIIVADCLELLLILFRNNTVNQNNFRELSLLGRITPLLDLYGNMQSNSSNSFSENKVRIVTLALKVVSTFVSATNPNLYTNQSLLAKEKVLPMISQIALSKICPTTQLRSHALEAMADLIRHHVDNQNFIATLEIEIDGNKHAALLRLVVLALNSPFFSERWGAAAAVSAFTAEHQEGQCALISALTPPPVADERSIGQHLLGGLFGWESNPIDPSAAINCWFASLLIQSILKDNSAAKEMATKLPIQLPRGSTTSATSSSNSSSLHPNLLSKCAESLMLAVKANAHQYIKLAVARLLCVWLVENPNGVSVFLSLPQALSFLVEQVTAASNAAEAHLQGMCALLLTVIFLGGETGTFSADNSPITLIAQRVGLEKLAEKLDLVKKSEAFSFAEEPSNVWTVDRLNRDAEHPLFLKTLIFDYDFTLFLKEMHDKLQKQIRKGVQLSRPRQPPVKPHAATLTREVTLTSAAATGTSPTSQQNRPASSSSSSTAVADDVVVGAYREQISALRNRVAELETAAEKAKQEKLLAEQNPLENVSVLRKLLEEKDLEAAQLRRELDERIAAETQAKLEPAADSAQVQTLTKAYVELEAVLHQREAELEQLRKNSASANGQSNVMDSLKERNRLLETDNARLHSLVQALQKEVSSLQAAKAASASSPDSATTAAKLKQLEEKFANLEAEQEELLVVLAKTEIENNNLKERLRLLGK